MTNFNLKIQLIEKTCLFELTWGEGQQLNASLTYLQTIHNFYQEWQQCYLKFYKSSFRGKVADIGTIAPPPIDWRAKLVEAETKFLSEFRHWLRSAELYQIRSTIINFKSWKFAPLGETPRPQFPQLPITYYQSPTWKIFTNNLLNCLQNNVNFSNVVFKKE